MAPKTPATRYVPFGGSSWAQDTYGITEKQLAIMVALCSAALSGEPRKTIPQLEEKLGRPVQGSMAELRRKGWAEQVATVERSTAKVWQATPRAFVRLELKDWQPLLFTDEELTRIDLSAPDFLKPLPAEEERAAS